MHGRRGSVVRERRPVVHFPEIGGRFPGVTDKDLPEGVHIGIPYERSDLVDVMEGVQQQLARFVDAELLQIAFKRHTVDVFELFAHVGHTALQLLTDRGKRDVFRIGAVDVFADFVNGRIALRNGVETDGVPERRGDDLNGVTAQHDVRAEGLASELVERIAEEALHPPIFIVKNGVHRRFPRQGVRWNDPAVEHDVVEDTSDTAEEIPDISLLEDGAFVYRIIRSDSGKGNAVTVCATLKKTLKTVTGADIEVLTDFEDKDSNDDIREILVGSTNRQASIDAMNDLGANEYIIRVTGNKIVIAGGSDEMLTMAVKQFLLNCAGYVSDADYTATDRITIKGNFELRNRIKEADKDIVILKTNDTISYVDRLVASVEGFHPKDKIRVAGLNDNMSTIFSTDKTELVIVAGADTITGQCRYALDQYLYKKGRVLMLGGPAFEKVTYLSDGKFLTLSEYLRSEYGKLTDDRKLTVFDTSDETAHSAFVRSRNPGSGVNNWDNGGWFSYGDFGFDSESGKQMKVRLTNLQSAGWAYDAFRCPFEADNAYKSKVNAIGFWAKSDEAEPTTGVVLELVDSQGVAWYAKVELTSEWQYYMFSAEDFSYYENRGNVATASSPQFAGIRSIGFGLDNAVFAQTQGNHAYYLTEVELLVMDSDMLNYIRDIDLDSVSPYTSVQYSITNGASIETYANQIFVTDRDYVLAEELVSCQPGTQGTGYNKGRYYRFIPLLEIKDAGGFHSGYAAWINLYSRTTSSTDREGAIVGYFSSCSADFYDVNGILAVADAAKAMSRDVFLIEGGSDEYTYIPEDTSEITVGGAYVDLSRYKDAEVTLAVELFDGDTLLGTYTSDSDLNSAPLFNGAMTFRNTFSISKERPNHVVTTLKADGVIVDRIEQTIDYWEAKPESERNYVYVEDGYYKRNGEIINVIGVNYWPSYHLALQYYNGEFDTRAKYDPDVVRADLARIKELGMTYAPSHKDVRA